VSGWRPAWRDLAASDEIKALEADLDEAERRILVDLASDPTAVGVARQMEAARVPERGPAPVPHGYRSGRVADRVHEVIDQTLTIPRGQGAARVVGDQVLFGVAMTVDQARKLLDAWVDLMDDEGDGEGHEGGPPSPEVVALSEFLFVLLDPLAERLSELPDPDPGLG